MYGAPLEPFNNYRTTRNGFIIVACIRASEDLAGTYLYIHTHTYAVYCTWVIYSVHAQGHANRCSTAYTRNGTRRGWRTAIVMEIARDGGNNYNRVGDGRLGIFESRMRVQPYYYYAQNDVMFCSRGLGSHTIVVNICRFVSPPFSIKHFEPNACNGSFVCVGLYRKSLPRSSLIFFLDSFSLDSQLFEGSNEGIDGTNLARTKSLGLDLTWLGWCCRRRKP